MIRAILSEAWEGAVKRFNAATGRGALQDREMFQHYGLTSLPPDGAELIVLRDGNIFISVAEDDRRYRLQVAKGEVALYSDEGDAVHLKRGRVVEITAGTKLTLNAPLVEISGGNLNVVGTVTGVAVQDAAGTMSALRADAAGMKVSYNGHAHNNPEGGVTGLPSPQM
ncbi:MAG: phage baseplate assembly protein [Elusimicrobiales bacterium]